MEYIPWRRIADWRCLSCGDCCKLYSVVINFHEWLRIVKNYGVEHTASGLDKLFLNRRSDGSCAFLGWNGGAYLCQLQHMKPRACQLWPFKVLSKPDFGYSNEALYSYGENRVYVYADPMCNGLRPGSPSLEFSNFTLREFVELAAGIRNQQVKTTSNLRFNIPYFRL
jgi:Fe-S-cluster containining protein